jgi:DNA-binding CsgD family transcriptional regulator
LSNPALTLREREVAEILAKGLKIKDVVALLKMRPRTAEAHRRSIYAKLDVTNRSELTLEALCANISETSSPSTITVGRGKKSHLDKHEQDQFFFRCVGSFGA